MAELRWSNSIHSQIRTIFSAIRSVGASKAQCPEGHIRSVGTLKTYLSESHRFGNFLQDQGVKNLRNTEAVSKIANIYLSECLKNARQAGQSLQTQETRASALSALERAFNSFFAQRGLPDRLNFADARREYLILSRSYLGRGREYTNGTRAYPEPEKLIAAMKNETHRLQAALQCQGGLRTEGVGSPSGRIPNPLTAQNLKGLTKDPVSGVTVGRVEVREKGGKWTTHYISQRLYERLEAYLKQHGSLQSRYRDYRNSVIEAAKATAQFSQGRGTHGLKTIFAHRRYAECVKYGFTHEAALQQVALELAHNRSDVTLVYTKG